MSEKRVSWKKIDVVAPVEQYDAYNSSGERLGSLELERVGAHMHWCWYQEEGIRMSPGCLQEVRDMQRELFARVRQK